MSVGDIKISSLKIGKIDLLDPRQAQYAGFNVYEDILNPLGVLADIRVIDAQDALGKNKLNGSYDQDVDISFGLVDSGSKASFKLKMMQNKNVDDQSERPGGGSSGHFKQYDIRCCSAELLNSQGNFVQKSYDDLTSNMIKDILKNNFKTNKTIDLEATSGKRRIVFSNEHPIKALRKLSSEHVSNENKSSAFVCFQQSTGTDTKYVFSTFEKLFKQSPVVTLKQSPSLNYGDISDSEKQNSIIWIKVSDSFFTPARSTTKAQQLSYNPTFGKTDQVNQKKTQFTTADKTQTFSSPPSSAKAVPVVTMKDAANDKTTTNVAEARKNRIDYLSHIAQNHALLEVPGNPSIKLGSMIELNVPNKSDPSSGSNGGEKQFNGKALVVSIRHKIKPLGQTPRYTMILGVIKGSYKEGGGENG